MKLKRAAVCINKDHDGVDEWDRVDEWYASLVHELYHILTQDVYYHAASLLDYIQDEATRGKERNMFTIYHEQTVEMLAQGFVNAYPLSHFDYILNPKENQP
jgi:hypothetical protein